MQIDATSLPVPCDKIVDGNWVNDPYQTVFPVPVSGPEAAQYLQAIAQGLCTLLQAQVRGGQGYVSAFAYNLFSQNGYQNQIWLAVISDCYDLATKIQTCNPNATPDQVLSTAIRKYHPYAVSNCINHFPVLQQILPQQQVLAAINAANSFKGELQQLEVNYNRMVNSQAQQQTGLLNVGGQPTAGMPSVQLVGGAGSFASPIGIFQEESSATDGWGGKRRRPSADSGLDTAKVPEIKPQAPDLQAQIPVRQPQAFTPITVDENGGVNLMNTNDLSLVPRRARRAEVQYDVDEIPAAKPAAKPAVEQTVAAATAALANVSVDDFLEVGEPVAVKEEGSAPVERQQLRLREPEAVSTGVVDTPQFKAREVVLPLNLRVLPDTVEEAKDAMKALDMREGVNRMCDGILVAKPIGEAEEEGKEPFGTFLAENDGRWLIQVVTADDTGWMPSAAQNMRCVYDPLKWHRALVRELATDGEFEGPVLEGFIEIKEGDNMNYLDLELDPVRREQYRAKLNSDKNYIPLAGEVLEITYIERQLLPIGSHHSLEKLEREAIENVKKAEPAPRAVRCQAVRGKRKEANVTCVELSNLLVESDVPYLAATQPASSAFRARAWTGGKRLTVKANGRPTRYLREQLGELLPILPAMAKQVDRLMAADINEVLLYGFGYEAIEVTSFAADYEDLIDHMLDVYSEDIVRQFEEGVDDRLNRWSITDDGKEIAVDADAFCVAVSCNLEDMGVNLLSEKLAIFTLSNCPNLASIVAHGQTSEANAVKSPVIYYVGRDGEIWKAHASVFDPSMAILIRQ